MLKTNFTKSKSPQSNMLYGIFWVLLMLIFLPGTVNGQCYLACNRFVQVSLDQNCQALITPAMMLNDTATSCPSGNFRVTVLKHKKPIPTSPWVGKNEIGLTLQVEVTDLLSGNKCWGEILVEDKLAPTINCLTDTIPCYRAARWNVTGTDNCSDSVNIVRLDEIINPYNCHPRFVKQLIRRYRAWDSYGNSSAVCSDTTYLTRFDTSRVVCPKDWSLANNCPINCKDIEYRRIPLDRRGHPDPSYTGVPVLYDTVSMAPLRIDTIKLFPITDIYCNIGTTYEDLDLGTINCVRKIMRMWTIREWHCSTEIRRICIQIIEIVDREPPRVHCVYDFKTTTDGGYRCEATVNLPPATVFDSCQRNNVRVDVVYPGGILLNRNGGVVKLPVGVNRIVYRAYDNCYNVDSCVLHITVEDKTAPVAICDRETVVALSVYGTTHVYARTFDDGSYDDCHIDSMLVRRMDNGGPCQIKNTYFKPYVEFCCADVGRNVTVIFRVKDKHGNFNDCMVFVEVQDKLKPRCTAPKNLTVSCDFHFDINNLSVFGVVQRDSALFNNKRTIRYKGYTVGRDSVINFHDGFASDNCDFTITHSFVDRRTQCNVGDLVRTWVVADRNGSDTCRQTITFFNFCPFNLDSIVWPRDTTLYGCLSLDRLTPEILRSRPLYPGEDRCDLLGQSYQDHVFRIVNGADACYKIIRKWKVIDWCQFRYLASGAVEYSQRTHEQIIKIHNTDDPVITANLRDTIFCTLDSCTTGPAVLTATGSDPCTPADELIWEFQIDYHRNGTIDFVRTGVGGQINASGRYPLGRHTIKYIFEDRCGNKTTRLRHFEIRNCKQPTPYCINGVAISLMPMDTDGDGRIDIGMIDVWASDVNQGSFGPCGNPVTFSFARDTNIKSLRFTCRELGQQVVEMWVTDRITGLQDHCKTFIDVQDNSRACQPTAGGTMNGLVRNHHDNQAMSQVTVELYDNAGGSRAMSAIVTQHDGRFAFSNMPYNNGNYSIRPTRNTDFLNGVSTSDIIRIQRHILAFEYILDPFKIIAADVNGDRQITSRDISELRRLILGQISSFSNNTSWRFIDVKYKFQNHGDEVLHEPYPQVCHIHPFNKDVVGIDFRGIKIGDVSGNASANLNGNLKSRSNAELSFVAVDKAFSLNEEVAIPFKVEQERAIAGFQFTLRFDPSKLEFSSIKPAMLLIGMENIGLQQADKGLISFSWNHNKAIQLAAEQPLFIIHFKALSKGQLSKYVSISSDITRAEAFDESLNELDVKLGFRSEDGQINKSGFVLYQNQPNPFSDFTTIGFELPAPSPAVLTVYDLNGKVILRRERDAAKGFNQFEINNLELGVAGVLYYQLDAAGYSATRRMVVIQ